MNYLYLKSTEGEYWINLAKVESFYRTKSEAPFTFIFCYDDGARATYDGVETWEVL